MITANTVYLYSIFFMLTNVNESIEIQHLPISYLSKKMEGENINNKISLSLSSQKYIILNSFFNLFLDPEKNYLESSRRMPSIKKSQLKTIRYFIVRF